MYADDRFNRAERPFEAHYFDTKGTSEITVPEGTTHVGVMRGFEYEFEERNVEVVADKKSEVTVKLRPIEMRRFDASWISGDVHVHMNYAGTYRNTPAHLADQAAAENLSIIENLVVNKEQRFPDIAYFSPELDPISNEHFASAARAGISHELLGTSRGFEPDAKLDLARICCISEHGRGQPVSHECPSS